MNNYTKTMWVDHLVENPDRYNIIYNPDNSITLSPREGEVFQEGTPINAIHLNQLEEGVYQALTGEILLGEFQGESRKLVLKKGIEGAMPTLAEGELGYATDTRKLFMGTSTGNASVMPEIDVSGAVEEVVDRRVNHVKNKSLSQIILEETKEIRDYFVSKITERINSVTNKSLNQVVKEDIITTINQRINSDLTKPLDDLMKSGAGNNIAIFTSNGVFIAPDGVTTVKITSCAAGGNGGNGGDGIYYPGGAGGGGGGGGGGAGQCIIGKTAHVTPGELVNIVVGSGNTVIEASETVVLLKGKDGNPGKKSMGDSTTGGNGGTGADGQIVNGLVCSAGGNGGRGASRNTTAESGSFGGNSFVKFNQIKPQNGGNQPDCISLGGVGEGTFHTGGGGGGGASIFDKGSDGARGAKIYAGDVGQDANNAGIGAGGGGGGGSKGTDVSGNTSPGGAGGLGGHGIVIIEW